MPTEAPSNLQTREFGIWEHTFQCKPLQNSSRYRIFDAPYYFAGVSSREVVLMVRHAACGAYIRSVGKVNFIIRFRLCGVGHILCAARWAQVLNFADSRLPGLPYEALTLSPVLIVSGAIELQCCVMTGKKNLIAEKISGKQAVLRDCGCGVDTSRPSRIATAGP